MCFLFSDDLTVTDSIPLCSLPTHAPLRNQNSRKRRLTGRTAGRQRMEGYQVRKTTGASSSFSLRSLFPPARPPASSSSTLELFGHRFSNGKKFWPRPVLRRWKNNFDFLCGEEHICEKNGSACEGMIGFTQSCPQCVNMSLWKNVCSITCLFMSD